MDKSIGERHYEARIKAGKAKAIAFGLERLYRRKRHQAFLLMEGNIPEREAKASTYADVVKAEDEWLEAERKAILWAAEADGLATLFEEWRTQQASYRAEMQLR